MALLADKECLSSKKFLVGGYTDTSWMAQNRLHPKILIISFPQLSVLHSSRAPTPVKRIWHNSELLKWAESFHCLLQTWPDLNAPNSHWSPSNYKSWNPAWSSVFFVNDLIFPYLLKQRVLHFISLSNFSLKQRRQTVLAWMNYE